MRIKANGIQMDYEISGKTDGPVVMLSHSLGSSLVMWEPQRASLETHFNVLRYDLRGHGGSEAPPGPYTLDLLVDDAVSLLDGLGINRVHWVGLSIGGMIGQCFALKHADRLWSVVLCSTSAVVPREGQRAWQERMDTAAKQGMEALLQTTMERWFTPSFIKKAPPVLELIRRQFLATPVEGYIGCCAVYRELNYLDRLAEINIPTLIITGENDPRIPVATAKAMHERIKSSKLVVLPSAAHLSNVEQPEVFNAVLLKFLRGL